MLEYVDGPVAHGLQPLSVEHLGRVGRLVRDLHDAPRLAALVHGYGLDEARRRRLPALLERRTQAMYELLVDGARSGRRPWARLHAEGDANHWGPAADYITQHTAEWTAAIT